MTVAAAARPASEVVWTRRAGPGEDRTSAADDVTPTPESLSWGLLGVDVESLGLVLVHYRWGPRAHDIAEKSRRLVRSSVTSPHTTTLRDELALSTGTDLGADAVVVHRAVLCVRVEEWMLTAIVSDRRPEVMESVVEVLAPSVVMWLEENDGDRS